MQTNSNISYTGLVEKYIGTAYDKMAELHSNLQALLLIAGSIEDGSFDEVAKIADELQTVIDKIDEFNSTYYGALPSTPVLDPNGDPITPGDLYYDIGKRLMYVFVDGFWVPLGAVNMKVIHVIVGGEHFENENTVVIDLGHDPDGIAYAYIPGTNNMSVHRNGKLLVSDYVRPERYDYEELNDTEIRFFNADLDDPKIELGDEVIFSIGTEAATVTHIGKVSQFRYVTNDSNETIITLPPGESYIPGTLNLTVHLMLDKGDNYDRSLQLVRDEENSFDGDYIELDSKRIIFTKTLPAKSEVIMTVGHVVANDDAHFGVIMSTETPAEDAYDEGQLWFREDTGRMYILYFDDVPNIEEDGVPHKNRQWISVTPEDTVIGDGGVYKPDPDPPTVIHGTVFQDTVPDPKRHAEGTLWFNQNTGNLHIKYQDINSHQWVKVSN